MGPSPNWDHQDLQGALETFIRTHLRARSIKVIHSFNLASPGGWSKNYRIPDLVLIGPDRRGIDRREYLEGAPDVVVEIESPGDETREKMPFYAKIGVPEFWIIDRDSKEPEVHLLGEGGYERQAAGPEGWLASPFAGIEMRARGGKLLVRIRGDDSTLESMPED